MKQIGTNTAFWLQTHAALGESSKKRLSMRTKSALACATAAMALSIGLPVTAQAAVVTVANPNISSDIGARIRWGGRGLKRCCSTATAAHPLVIRSTSRRR